MSRPTRRQRYLTLILMGLNVLVWLWCPPAFAGRKAPQIEIHHAQQTLDLTTITEGTPLPTYARERLRRLNAWELEQTQALSPADLARVADYRAEAQLSLGDPGSAWETLAGVDPVVLHLTDDETLSRFYSWKGEAAFWLGDAGEALSAWEHARDVYIRLPDQDEAATVEQARQVIMLSAAGYFKEAAALMLPEVGEPGASRHLAWTRLANAWLANVSGDFPRSQSVPDQETGAPASSDEVWFLVGRLEELVVKGRYPEAELLLDQKMPTVVAREQPLWTLWLTTIASEIGMKTGDVGAARYYCEQFSRFPTPPPLLAARVARVQAELALLHEDRSGAIVELKRALEIYGGVSPTYCLRIWARLEELGASGPGCPNIQIQPEKFVGDKQNSTGSAGNTLLGIKCELEDRGDSLGACDSRLGYLRMKLETGQATAGFLETALKAAAADMAQLDWDPVHAELYRIEGAAHALDISKDPSAALKKALLIHKRMGARADEAKTHLALAQALVMAGRYTEATLPASTAAELFLDLHLDKPAVGALLTKALAWQNAIAGEPDRVDPVKAATQARDALERAAHLIGIQNEHCALHEATISTIASVRTLPTDVPLQALRQDYLLLASDVLLQQQQPQKAQHCLSGIDPASLTSQDRAGYDVLYTKIAMASGRIEDARKMQKQWTGPEAVTEGTPLPTLLVTLQKTTLQAQFVPKTTEALRPHLEQATEILAAIWARDDGGKSVAILTRRYGADVQALVEAAIEVGNIEEAYNLAQYIRGNKILRSRQLAKALSKDNVHQGLLSEKLRQLELARQAVSRELARTLLLRANKVRDVDTQYVNYLERLQELDRQFDELAHIPQFELKPPMPPTLADVQQALRQEQQPTLILEYLWRTDRLVSFVIDSTGIHAITQPGVHSSAPSPSGCRDKPGSDVRDCLCRVRDANDVSAPLEIEGSPVGLSELVLRLTDPFLCLGLSTDGGRTQPPYPFEHEAQDLLPQVLRSSWRLHQTLVGIHSKYLPKPNQQQVGTLIVVPDGALNQVPFAALAPLPKECSTPPREQNRYEQGRASRPARCSTDEALRHSEFLGLHFAQETLPTTGLLLEHFTVIPSESGGSVFGSPSESGFGADESDEILGIHDTLKSATPPKSVELYRGGEVTSARLLSAVQLQKYVHVSTHGLAASVEAGQGYRLPYSLLFTSAGLEQTATRVRPVPTKSLMGLSPDSIDALLVALAGDTQDPRERWLSVEELRLPLVKARLISLSACMSGLGELAMGESSTSIGASLLAAGAAQTISSLWPVSVNETSQLFRLLYTGHLEGELAPSVAMLRARQSIASGSQGPHQPSPRHPFYWAGFDVNGHLPRVGEAQPSR